MWNCRLPLSRRSSDGPDNMALTVNGQNSTSFPAGTNLTMLCSAQSNPPAQLQWAVRGELVNATSHLLELSSVNQGQSGEYTCLAFNNHTDMKSSVTKHIVIAGRFVCTVTSASVFIHLVSFSPSLNLHRAVRMRTTGRPPAAPLPAATVWIPLTDRLVMTTPKW